MSGSTAPEAWITGIGLVSSLGDGVEAHWSRLTAGGIARPVVDEAIVAPHPIHPLGEIAFETQIPGRGDRRQMSSWQQLGTYAAGLALADAGLAEDDQAKAGMHLLVAAGAGDRDPESDRAVFSEVSSLPDDEAALNRTLMDTLRPTLFLSQLANMLAGNIAIVHGVTGSSCSLMGAEMAGISAIENAVRRIHAGHDRLFLVGGSFVAASSENLLQLIGMQLVWDREWRPVWQRSCQGGGASPGSVGAFLVIEARDHAMARGARAYAALDGVVSGRGGARHPMLELTDALQPGPLLVMSGASGIEPQTGAERAVLEGLAEGGFELTIRAYASVIGLSVEAHFPAGVALAAIAAHRRGTYDPFEDTGFERPSNHSPDRILVTTAGQWRGAGAGLVAAVDA